MIKWGFFLCILFLSLGQFSAIYTSSETSIYLFDIIIGFFCVVGLIYYLGIKKRFVLPKFLMPFVVFAVIATISLGVQIYHLKAIELTVALFYLLRYISYLGFGFVVYNAILQKDLHYRSIFNALFISAFFITVIGFIQLIILPDFTTLDPSLGWDPHKNRLASTFFDPNFVGAYLVLCLTSALGFLFNKERKFTRVEVLAYLAIPFIGLLLTFSRSAWLMFGISILVYGLYKNRLIILVSVVVFLLAYLAVPRVQTRISGITDPADSASLRMVSWKNAFEIFKDNQLLGVGFNNYRTVQKEYGFFEVGEYGGHSGAGADSSFLFVAATTGIVGFAVFLFSFLFPTVATTKDPFKLIILSSFCGLGIESQFINSLFYPQILAVFVILLAVFSIPHSLRS